MNDSTKKEAKLKVDFNLLMSGTWVLDNRGRQKVHYFEKEVNDGKVVIYNALDVPSPTESKLLDYLMLKSQEDNWSQEIVIPSISQITKNLGLGRDKKTLDRVKKSLKILVNTRIEFHNCFIDNGILKHFEQGNWQLISTGIVAKYGFKHVKGWGSPVQVKVIFDDDFIALCKNSLGYKLIPYAPIQGLRDIPYALYKWAYRWYDSKKGYGERWIGDGKALVKWYKNELNSTANYKYPSNVLQKVSSAIKQLNANDKVPFSLKLKEENGKYKMVLRAKDCVIKVNQSANQSPFPYDNLPEADKDALLNYVKNNRKDIKNPYGFLRSMSEKELRIFMRRANGKKVLVSAGNKPAEEPVEKPVEKPAKQPKRSPLEEKIAEVMKTFGLNSGYLTCGVPGPNNEYCIWMPGLEPKETEELNANRELIDALTKAVGEPVRIA